jgi:hypothetical protein
VNEFPFPVKAQVYADVTQPPQPIQYAFELLETGTGQPAVAASATQAAKPPLDRTTNDGSHVILTWNPVQIQPNSKVSFGVTFQDSHGFPLQNVAYDFAVKNANGTTVQQFKDQLAGSGNGTQQVIFNGTGPQTVSVTMNSVGSRPTGQIIQTADFNIMVVPEFSVNFAIMTTVAAMAGLIIVTTRAGRTNLGSRLFGAKRSP